MCPECMLCGVVQLPGRAGCYRRCWNFLLCGLQLVFLCKKITLNVACKTGPINVSASCCHHYAVILFQDSPSRVYVGRLPRDVRESDIEDHFYKYGRIRNIDMKKG